MAITELTRIVAVWDCHRVSLGLTTVLTISKVVMPIAIVSRTSSNGTAICLRPRSSPLWAGASIAPNFWMRKTAPNR